MAIDPEQRAAIIRKVVDGSLPVGLAEGLLAGDPWESAVQVRLGREDLRAAMARFVSGESSDEELHEWAEFLETREDVDFRTLNQRERDILHRLANPILEGQIDQEFARLILATF